MTSKWGRSLTPGEIFCNICQTSTCDDSTTKKHKNEANVFTVAMVREKIQRDAILLVLNMLYICFMWACACVSHVVVYPFYFSVLFFSCLLSLKPTIGALLRPTFVFFIVYLNLTPFVSLTSTDIQLVLSS